MTVFYASIVLSVGSGNTGKGGSINLIAGTTTATSQSGGDITVQGGTATSSGSGGHGYVKGGTGSPNGNVYVQPGTGASSGSVYIRDASSSNLVVFLLQPVFSFVVSFEPQAVAHTPRQCISPSPMPVV